MQLVRSLLTSLSIMSASNICIVLLACFSLSAAQCSSAVYDPTHRPHHAVSLQPIHANYLRYNIDIPAEETCNSYSPGSVPLGVETTVCSQSGPAPDVTAEGLHQALVVAYSSTDAYVTVYCSPADPYHHGHQN